MTWPTKKRAAQLIDLVLTAGERIVREAWSFGLAQQGERDAGKKGT
jgi:hypothetical protein